MSGDWDGIEDVVLCQAENFRAHAVRLEILRESLEY